MRKYLRWPVLLILAALVVAALIPAFSLLHTGSLSKAHASGAASITLSSATGQPGTTLQASGQGFAPNDQINLYLNQVNGPLLASASADGSGNLPATNITVPSQPAGQYTVVAMQAQSDISANTTLTIVPIFSLSQKKVQPGALVGVKGAGFPFEDMIELFLDSTSGNSFTYGEDDYYGNISWSVNLPASSVVQGQHVIIAKSDTTGNILDFPVTFLPRAFPIVAKAGMAVQLTGASFAANETVQIYWGTQTGKLEGSATTDATGNLSFSFTAPSGLKPGSYPITIVRSHHKPALVLTQFKLIPVIMTSTPGILSGQPVKVAVTGFLPNENVTFAWNANGGQQLDSYWTDKNGALQTEFFPPSAPVGSYTLTGTGGTSGLQASNSLNIGPGVSGGYADPGSTITVTGGGFSAGETVNVYFQKPENGLVSVTTSASGSFTVQLTLPSTYNPSTIYYIHAVSATGNEQAAAKFTFYKLSFITSGYAYYNQTELYSGTNFAVNETVNIIWNYQQSGQYTIATVQADYSGSFSVSIVPPSTPNESNIVVAAVGVSSKLTATSSLVSYAAISSTPTTGVMGTKIVISGGSFFSSEKIALLFQGLPAGWVISNADGTFAAGLKVPMESGAGNATVEATGASSGISVTTVFNYTPFLTLSPSIVHNGDTIVVTGKHFSASTNVFVYWPGGSALGNPVYTDVNGSFTLTVQISGAASGADAVSAQDMLSNLFVSTPLVVE